MYSYFRLYEHGAIFKSFFCLFIFQLGLSLKIDQWSRTGERHAGFVIKQLFLQAIICHFSYSISSKTSFGGTYLFLSTTITKPQSQNFGMVVSMIRKVFLFFIFLLKKKKNYTGSLGQLFHSNLILLKRRTIHNICIILSRME